MSNGHSPDSKCAALHPDGQGDAIPCLGDHPEPPPELSEFDQLRADNEALRYMVERARWALGTDEPINERLQRAEIRAAVAEHEAKAYREQVQALIRSIQRERGVPEDEFANEDTFVVRVDNPAGMTEQRVRDIIRTEVAAAQRTMQAGQR